MPHSNRRASVDSEHSFNLLGPYNPNGPFPTKPGVALSPNVPRTLQSNAWKRQSLPASNNYADILGKTDWNSLQSRNPVERSIMAGFQDNARQQRPPVYDEQFKYRDTPYGARERVHRDSPVIAELRTNVIIKDEFTLVTDLSYHLAARYTRPDSSIMIKIDHSACLAMGGTFDPCYILSITAVPTQMGPTMNKRNAALIQSFLADILSVPPERGIVKFESILEENFATNGSTLLGEIERQEKQMAAVEQPGVRKPTTSNNLARMSMPSFRKSTHRLFDDQRTNGRPAPAPAPGPPSLDRIVIPNGNFSNMNSTPGLFELPGEVDRARPSTSHNTPSDGYRANSFTSRDATFRDHFQVKERPKSMVADAQSIQEQLMEFRTKPLPPLSYQSQPNQFNQTSSFPSITPQRQYSSSRPDATARMNGGRSAPNFSQGARHSHAMANESTRSLTKDSYLGSLIEAPNLPESAPTKKGAMDLDKKDTAANTAKRRSTITATPKFPEPPPIPSETTSLKSSSMRVGKRKSFMKVLKRVTTAAG